MCVGFVHNTGTAIASWLKFAATNTRAVPARFGARVCPSWAPELSTFTRTGNGHVTCWKSSYGLPATADSKHLMASRRPFWNGKGVTSCPRTHIHAVELIRTCVLMWCVNIVNTKLKSCHTHVTRHITARYKDYEMSSNAFRQRYMCPVV